ncbi:class I SAM-dependent methyltransferase [Fredinandcohnia sp. 179-A 10B2 NHS]|uniref:class I SAM-dependent methyltransferase n=1 Tax=Fredinandcohnia sp. 179-A 10B2 NHS TaxID=3235176 RepID=UPI0039A1DA8C
MSKVFPKFYDIAMKPLEVGRFKQIRKSLLQKAKGRVIEIGSGTGVNFPLYRNVESVTAIEPSQYMIELSKSNKELASVPIEIVQASAETLPFGDHTYDTVVATLVFCTIPNVRKALHEIKRLCKPNGKILLFEHVKMNNPILAKLQDLLTPAWSKICDGCCLNRETVNVLQQEGFQITNITSFYKGLFVVIEIENTK